jgi:predicted rRNA methylase YqxC with S4 and FtsJ domains
MIYSTRLFDGNRAYTILDELVEAPVITSKAWGKIVEDVGISRGPFADVIIKNGEEYTFDEDSKSYVKGEL